MQRRKETERIAIKRDRPIRDKSTRAAPSDEDALPNQGLQTGTDACPTDAKFTDQFPLWREPRPDPELAFLNQPPDMNDNQLRGQDPDRSHGCDRVCIIGHTR